IIQCLQQAGNGCRLFNTFIGRIMYADDILLLSASVIDLQKMLDTCGNIGCDLDIKFNSNKSMCMSIGSNMVNPEPMNINNATIQRVAKVKYLGITIAKARKFTIDFSEIRRKFFASVNSILSKCKYASDLVKLELLEVHCLPVLLYAIDCLNLPHVQLCELNSWWNSVYRKMFNYNKWES